MTRLFTLKRYGRHLSVFAPHLKNLLIQPYFALLEKARVFPILSPPSGVFRSGQTGQTVNLVALPS